MNYFMYIVKNKYDIYTGAYYKKTVAQITLCCSKKLNESQFTSFSTHQQLMT